MVDWFQVFNAMSAHDFTKYMTTQRSTIFLLASLRLTTLQHWLSVQKTFDVQPLQPAAASYCNGKAKKLPQSILLPVKFATKAEEHVKQRSM